MLNEVSEVSLAVGVARAENFAGCGLCGLKGCGLRASPRAGGPVFCLLIQAIKPRLVYVV